MIKILFVCHGNICRSPMAEIFMKDDLTRVGLSEHFYIDSAAVSSEEIINGIGNPVYPPAKAELKRHGLSCEGKRARLMTRDDYQKFNLLIGMDSSNISWMNKTSGGDPDGKIFKLLDFADDHLDIAGRGGTGNLEKSVSMHMKSRDVAGAGNAGNLEKSVSMHVKSRDVAGAGNTGNLEKSVSMHVKSRDVAGAGNTGNPEKSVSMHMKSRDVADPWYTGDFEATWNDIMKGCTALREILTFKNNLVLASGSPRRKELLEQIGYSLTIDPSDAEENVDITEFKNSVNINQISNSNINSHGTHSASERIMNKVSIFDTITYESKNAFVALYVEKLSEVKALDVAKRHPNDFVLGADTVVSLDGKILGKPKSEDDAKKMLSMLSGKTHHVYTGVTILRTFRGQIVYKKTFSECTEVVFYELGEKQIDDYIATGEPMDKAGTYGIQGRGAVLVKEIHGDYNNVVGLPIAAVDRILKY